MSRQTDANATRTTALEILEETRAKLHSFRFLNALRTASQAERDAASTAMLEVALARQALATAILGEIVDELEAEKAALDAAINRLDKALDHLDRVKPVLDAIAAVIGVVGRIVKIV